MDKAYEELLNVSEEKNITYDDYMCSQPMRDGEEIRGFFEDLNESSVVSERR